MSYEAWGDGDDGDDRFTEDRVEEIGTACFLAGARFCREMMARFVEQGGDASTAQSIRANWNPSWGEDAGEMLPGDYAKGQGPINAWDWTP